MSGREALGSRFATRSPAPILNSASMPLRAIIAGESVLAFELSPHEWNSLKGQLRADRSSGRLPCCDAPVVAKTSKLGTKFFAHYVRGACESAPETETHLTAKRAVYEGCIDAGWEAITEAVGPDGAWRADVLAWRRQKQVAFEIQWSPQSAERTVERHNDLARHQVRCCWLFRRFPFVRPTRQVPAFQLVESPEGNPPLVALTSGTRSLREFARLMLEGRIKFCADVRVRIEEVRCRIRQDRCPRCAGIVHFADATAPPLVSPCGLDLLRDERFSAIQRLYAQWARAFEALRAEDLLLGSSERAAVPGLLLRSPPGKPFVTAAGRSGFCPECLAVVPVTNRSDQLPIVFETDVPVKAPEWPDIPFPHWCLGSDGAYCSRK